MRAQISSSAIKNIAQEAYTTAGGENECAQKKDINRNIWGAPD